ncbi:MAG: GFA family protein [Gammaproteobacteria bacterium]|nr:GFA family protein [Gammaproteobacteria bacterium]
MHAPPLSVQHCHCETCRKTSGSFYVTGGVVRRDMVEIEGAENLTKYRASITFEHQFCRTCGCYLFAYDDDETNLFYIAIPTLDGGVDPGHPRDMESHIYMGLRAEWEHVSDTIPHFEKNGPGEIITEIQRIEAE